MAWAISEIELEVRASRVQASPRRAYVRVSPDNTGASVISNPVRPQELATTIYHALDIPLNEPQNNTGIARPITLGKPVLGLFG